MSLDSTSDIGTKSYEIEEGRVVRLSKQDGLVGKAAVTKPFSITTQKDGDGDEAEYRSEGPFGLLVSGSGKTARKAANRLAAQQS